jgi:cell division protein FtsI (penicillin-binding protein 3)
MLGRTDSRSRLLLLLVALVVTAGSLFSRLAWWQVAQHDGLALAAAAQTSLHRELPSRRGAIYDRSGTVLLATTVDRYTVGAATDLMTSAQRTATGAGLATILGLDSAGAADLQAKLDSGRPYVVLAKDLDESVVQKIRAGQAAGSLTDLSLDSVPTRVYPQKGGGPDSTLAAQLLGFVNLEGVGQYGIEQRYQDVLAGRPETIVAQRDANGNPLPDTQQVVEAGAPGVDVRLTIDARLQLALEQELLAAWVADHAVDVSAVVLDPYTGEVYAEASYPSYDANDYRAIAASDPSRFIDPIVSSVYEPGSVLKMLTAVAGLSTNTVTLDTRINDTGILKLDGGRTHVDDADHHARGWMTFQDIVAYSRNVGASKVALQLGKNTRDAASVLYDTWTRLGFGVPTGIDLAGEVGGIIRDPTIRPWSQIDLANASFGQGVAVSAIQLATAFAAMVNGGTLVQPHVAEAIGQQVLSPSARAEGVLPASLSPDLIGLMRHVVTTVPFYRDRTLVPGYLVGGKTGTAQIWDPKANGGHGGWKHNLFNYSFVGYIGKKRPELIVAVRIHEGRPTIARIGQLEMPVMSFELFRRIATDAITTLDLDPQRGSPSPATAPEATPAPPIAGVPNG